MAGPLDALITEWSDDFQHQIADGTVNRLDASGEYDYNIGRHAFYDNDTFIYDIADTTKLVDLPAKFQITASPGDEHVFAGRELIRYVPNYELLFGAAAWAENTLQDGQHYAIEFSQDDFSSGYRYHFEGTTDGVVLTLEQATPSGVVSNTPDLEALEEESAFRHTQPFVARAFLNWYGAGNARYTLSYPRAHDDTGEIMDQENPIIGRTANLDDVATDGANQRVQVRVWCDSGGSEFTVNVCSMGALIRGNATEVDREKPSVHWGIGGSISQYPVDNASDALAARIDPARNNVAVKVQPPLFAPGGSGVTMELGVYAVHKDHPDLAVDFSDPDDDGAVEGPSPAAQARAQTDVMQYTRSVSSIPTTTDVRADASEGLVPDMRHITSTVGQSGTGNSGAQASGGEGQAIRRSVYRDDVVVFLPRTNPGGNTTAGVITWLKPLFTQDW